MRREVKGRKKKSKFLYLVLLEYQGFFLGEVSPSGNW
jgi:hypothetical protein